MRHEIKLDPPRALHMAMDNARELRLTVYRRVWVEGDERDTTGLDFTFEDVTARSRVDFDPAAPAIAAFDPATGIIRASGTGTRRVLVTVHAPDGRVLLSPATHSPTTLTVHATLDDWWLGNETLTVPRTGALEHGQISVHAHFGAPPPATPGIGTIADITGHGYVDLAPADATVARLDTGRRGRVTGLKAGTTRVTGTFLGHTEQVDLHVVDRYAELPGQPVRPRAALERVVYNGPPSERSNVLFLGEGFVAADRALFDQAVREIAVNRLFRQARHSPFPKLASDFNVWSVFDASRQRGLTYGPRVSTPSIAGNAPLILQAIDSAYGLYKPWRPEDDNHRPSPLPGPLGLVLRGDPRRFPREVNWVRMLSRQIASLADPLVANTADPEHHVGRHWRNGGKDYGLVCIIVNEGGFRAENLGAFVTVGFSYETRWAFEHKDPGERARRWEVKRTGAARAYRTQADAFDDAADVTAHELAHSLVLGDEYEEDGGERWTLNADGTVDDPQIVFDNLARPTDVHAGLPGFDMAQRVEIDPARIKWGALHRVDQSDRIREAVWNVPSIAAMEVTLTLDHDPTARWDAARRENRDVFIRELLVIRETSAFGDDEQMPVSQVPVQLPRGSEGAPTVIAGARITQIRAAQRQLVLSVPQAALPPNMRGMTLDGLQTLLPLLFVPGSVVYIPKRDAAGAPLVLIDSAVAAWMATSHDPLSSNYQVGAGCDPTPGKRNPSSPDYPPKAAAGAGRSMPRHSFKVIGLYEGGAHKSCRIYRPAGFCKMRNQHSQATAPPDKPTQQEHVEPELCYVCKYLIANRINPRRLEEIEGEYPEIKKRRP